MGRVKIKIKVPTEVEIINEIFKNNGYELFLVGGCVRDSILNISPKDWDLVTNAKPSDVIALLKNESFVSNILETGEKFGVINVITSNDEFEIATMRKDVSYNNSNRRPDSVEFTNIETDISRRDLTCNALFYDLETNEVVDLVGGINDIANGVIKTVGDATSRFNEDRLRILRAIRFASRFGSNLSKEIEDSLMNDSSLEGISSERVRDEFLKGIKSSKFVPHLLSLIDKFNLFKWVFKGLKVNKTFIEEKDYLVLLTFMLRHNTITELRTQLNVLKFTTEEINNIVFLLNLSNMSVGDVYNLKKRQSVINIKDEQIIKIGKLFNLNPKLINTFLKFKLSVTGTSLIKQGVNPGPDMGDLIKKMETDNFFKLFNSIN